MCSARAELADATAMKAEAEAELRALVPPSTQASDLSEADAEAAASWEGLIAQSDSDLAAAAEKLRDLEGSLLDEVLPKDVDDERSALLEVRAGTGGDEAALFAREVFHMYEEFARQQKWKFQVRAIFTAKNKRSLIHFMPISQLFREKRVLWSFRQGTFKASFNSHFHSLLGFPLFFTVVNR